MLKTISFVSNTKIPIEDFQEQYTTNSRLLIAAVIGLFNNDDIKNLFKIESMNQDRIIIRPRNRFTPKRDFKFILTANNQRIISLQVFTVDEYDNEEIEIGHYLPTTPIQFLLLNSLNASDHDMGNTPTVGANNQQNHVPGYLKILSVDSRTKIYFFGGYSTDLNIVVIKTLIDEPNNKYQFSLICSSNDTANSLNNGVWVNNTDSSYRKIYNHYIFTDGEEVKTKVLGRVITADNGNTGFHTNRPYYNKGDNIDVAPERTLIPFQEGNEIIKNVYYIDGGQSIGTLIPTLVKIGDNEYYIFLGNIIAKSSPTILPYNNDNNNLVTAIDKIEILRQTVGDGSSGLYLAIRNTNTTSDILLDVYKNEEKVKVLTVKHRGSGLTPIVTYDGIEFPAITTYGEQVYILKGDAGDNFSLVFSNENNLNLIKQLQIQSTNIFFRENFFTTGSTSILNSIKVYDETSTPIANISVQVTPTQENSRVYYFLASNIPARDMSDNPITIYILSKNNNSHTVTVVDANNSDVTSDYTIIKSISFIGENNELEEWQCTLIPFISSINMLSYTAGTRPNTVAKMLSNYQFPKIDVIAEWSDTIKPLRGGLTYSYYPILGATSTKTFFSPETIVNLINLIQQYNEELIPIETSNNE